MNTNSHLPNLIYAITSVRQLFVRETMTAPQMQVALPVSIDIAARQLRNTISQDILWGLNGRFERGVGLAKQGAVSPYSDPNLPTRRHLFQVRSANQSSPPYHYRVDLEAGTCECPDHRKGHFCKHRIASHIIEIFNYNQQMAVSSTTQSSSTTLPAKDNPVQADANAPATENALKLSETMEETNLPVQPDSVIWGVIKHGGQWLGIEILSMDDDNATIRALPKITEGNKLQPQFPFEGKRCTITIPKKHLFHVKIFQ